MRKQPGKEKIDCGAIFFKLMEAAILRYGVLKLLFCEELYRGMQTFKVHEF